MRNEITYDMSSPTPSLRSRSAQTRFLVSVRDLFEAEIAIRNGADVIDLKEPTRGALGAVELEILKQVAQFVGERKTISATIGDPGMDAPTIQRSIMERFEAGAHYVKIGLSPNYNLTEIASALPSNSGSSRGVVAVLFADFQPQIKWLEVLANSGFAGVMLDTATKETGGLCDYLPVAMLQRFVDKAHELGMFCGLAGSLQDRDIPPLLPLKADFLGFRGALCREGRSSEIDGRLIHKVGHNVKGDCTPPRLSSSMNRCERTG